MLKEAQIDDTYVILGEGIKDTSGVVLIDDEGNELMTRVEMLTGVSVYGQAQKCRELLDLLRENKILGRLNKDTSKPAAPADDPLEQLKKLNALKEAGILSDEEFNAKKAELLSKI